MAISPLYITFVKKLLMDTVLRINAASLNEAFIKNFHQQFGQAAEVEIRVHPLPGAASVLQEEQFWEIIGLLDWTKGDDREAVMEPAVAALAALSLASIHQFADILAEKLWRLDTEAHALASLGGNAEERLSEDLFLYDRCFVVASGQAFFEKVLRDPAAFSVSKSFSPLLRLASMAYERKTGEKFVHIPAFDYETYSNEKGWE